MSYQYLGRGESKARKEHRCSWCGEHVSAGESYRWRKGVYEGEFQYDVMHPECDAAMDREMKGYGGLDYEYVPYSNPRGRSEYETTPTEGGPRP